MRLASARVGRGLGGLAEAIEQMETAAPHADQRAEWQENYIRECMDRRGFRERSTI